MLLTESLGNRSEFIIPNGEDYIFIRKDISKLLEYNSISEEINRVIQLKTF